MLRACGFDLSMALVPFDPEAPAVARLVELSRLTPKERLDAALMRRGSEQMNYPFDPNAVLGKLDERRVEYILVGSLARVMHGADEIPAEVDLVIPKGARFASDEAILTFAIRAVGVDRDGDAWFYRLPEGLLRVWEVPEGTRGHRDLRRRAERVHLGGGLRPWVAAPGDLVRMMEALGRPEHAERLEAMRRLVELERGSGREPRSPGGGGAGFEPLQA